MTFIFASHKSYPDQTNQMRKVGFLDNTESFKRFYFIRKRHNLPFCTNEGISCVNQIISNIGEEGENYVIDDIRGYKREDKIQCLSR